MKIASTVIALAAMSFLVLCLAGTPAELIADSQYQGGDQARAMDQDQERLQDGSCQDTDATATEAAAASSGDQDQDRDRDMDQDRDRLRDGSCCEDTEATATETAASSGDQDQNRDQDRDQDQDRDRAGQDTDAAATETAASSGDQDQDRDRDMEQDRDRLRDGSCREDIGLSDADLALLQPEIQRALALTNGDPETLRKMLQKAVGEGCTGDCLQLRLREWNRIMAKQL